MNASAFFHLLLSLPLCLALGACTQPAPSAPSPETGALPASSVPAVAAPQPGLPAPETPAPRAVTGESPALPAIWQPLWERLNNDGLNHTEIAVLFTRLGDSASQAPMGTKVQELYTNKFLRQPKPAVAPTPDATPNTTGIPRPWFKGFVTDANARRCRNFINAYPEAFRHAEETYGVPAEVAASLLYVETRLGDYLGEQKALITLASMSVTRNAESIPDWLAKLPGVEDHLDWVNERMADKAEWAYGELKALLRYSVENGVDPSDLPCSAYGAIGLCQFMPSNLPRFAVDGDGDGVVDLFNPADAVASLSNYLAKNGWRPGMTVPEQVKVLKRYNNLTIYANTILALASKVRDIPANPTADASANPTTDNVLTATASAN